MSEILSPEATSLLSTAPIHQGIADSLAAIETQVLALTGSPAAVDMLFHAMAVVVDSQWRDARIPDWVLLIGPPSSWKTAALMNLKGPYTHFLDTASSAASFLSGFVDLKTGSRARSLLSELHNRTLVIKDFTALLSDDPKKAKSILGAMTNHFDGEFSKGIGTALTDTSKSAMLTSKSRYSFIGAVTPATFSTHTETMAGMGARMLCYVVPPRSSADMAFTRLQRRDLTEQYQALHAQVTEHIARVLATPPSITFTEDTEQFLSAAATLVSRGRRAMRWTDTPNDEGRSERDWSLWEEEAPYRVYQQLAMHLMLLTRLAGLATPSGQELERVAHLAIGSSAFSRAQVLLTMREQPESYDGRLGVFIDPVRDALELSESHVRFLLNVLIRSKVLTSRPGKTGKLGRPVTFYEPVEEFRPLFWGGSWGLPTRPKGQG